MPAVTGVSALSSRRRIRTAPSMMPGRRFFNNDVWMKAFETCGVDIDFYTTRERSLDELFPWDFIDTGVTKEFLKTGVEKRHGRKCDAQLPGTLFRLRRETVRRRCLF